MFLLAADWAIFERLSGAPLDSRGRPILGADGLPMNQGRILPPERGGGPGPSWGVRIPMMKYPYNPAVGYRTDAQDGMRRYDVGFDIDQTVGVPIFDETLEDRPWENTWPSITFRQDDVLPGGPGEQIYGDPFGPNDRANPGIYEGTTAHAVTTSDGRHGYSSYNHRVHPDPWYVTYTIRCFAKTKVEINLLEAQILYLFPRFGSILVLQADGSKEPRDLIFTGRVNLDFAGGQMGRANDGSEQGHYSRAMTYRLETFADNTVNGYGVADIYEKQAVVQRIFQAVTYNDGIVSPTPEIYTV